jgi:hypothetical protein
LAVDHVITCQISGGIGRKIFCYRNFKGKGLKHAKT